MKTEENFNTTAANKTAAEIYGIGYLMTIEEYIDFVNETRSTLPQLAYKLIVEYNAFLKQRLLPSMFIPFDEDGRPLEDPQEEEAEAAYIKACKTVLFSGWRLNLCTPKTWFGMAEIISQKDGYLVIDFLGALTFGRPPCFSDIKAHIMYKDVLTVGDLARQCKATKIFLK